jgi:hypothetical protein
LCTNKRKLNIDENIRVRKNIFVIIQIKLPQKCRDPSMLAKDILDFGASINVMPLSIYKDLNLEPLKETR